ncbi:MAG: hypothetical protein IKN47_02180 [Lachnospiraceae bacterium]|nr:hypothetical protein [Lachnospiraceae bacterium]
MNTEYLIMDDAQSLMKWSKRSESVPTLNEKQAGILIDQLAAHDSELMVDESGKLYFKEGDKDLLEIGIDDVIDQACEWNYRDIRDLKSLRMNSYSFEEYCTYDDKMSELKKTERILNKLFDQTSYGRQITKRMKELVEKTWGKDKVIPIYDIPMYEDKVREDKMVPEYEAETVPAVSQPITEYEPSKGR